MCADPCPSLREVSALTRQRAHPRGYGNQSEARFGHFLHGRRRPARPFRGAKLHTRALSSAPGPWRGKGLSGMDEEAAARKKILIHTQKVAMPESRYISCV